MNLQMAELKLACCLWTPRVLAGTMERTEIQYSWQNICFYVTDEMNGCLMTKTGREKWPHKTGACLTEVHLHVKSAGGHETARLRQVLV